MRLESRFLPFLVLLSAFPVPALAQDPPDLLLTNGRVFTADSARPWAEAVAILGGTIAAVGSAAEVEGLAGPGTEVIDVEGRVVVPGLNDAHVHVGAWPAGTWLDLGGEEEPFPDPAWADVVAALSRAAAEGEEGSWIFGTIGVRVLDDPRAGRAALDSVAPDHPVYLRAATGHGLIVNTKALERLGIPLDAPDHPGGWFGRVSDTGEIDGVLWEYADLAAARSASAAEGVAAQAEAYRRMADRALAWGITSIQQMSTHVAVNEAVEAAIEAALPLRWGILRWPIPAANVAEAWDPERISAIEGGRVRVFGIKWMLDGTPIERRALLRQPYADRAGWAGRANFSEEELRAILAAALREEEQLALHVVGDSTLVLVLETMRELAEPSEWRRRRVRIEHGDGLMPDLVPAARELGIVVIQNPLHFAAPEVMHARWGDRADRYQLVRSLLEAGIPLALGADAGGEAMNPWLNVMFAVLHPANPAEALSVEQTVIAYTRGSAYAERMEAEKGMIREGMLADLAVLSQDVFAVPVDSLPATTSVLTIIGGEIVHRTLDP